MRKTFRQLISCGEGKLHIKHVSRARRLTVAEAEKYRALRETLEREMSAILAEHREQKK
jgi:hypothetical protein